MKRVYLFCNAGMSTSFLAGKMQDVADKHNLPIEVKAFPDSKMADIVEKYNPDVILLGPQVKFRFNATNEKYGDKIPVEVINVEHYGLVDGESVLKRAITLIKKKGK